MRKQQENKRVNHRKDVLRDQFYQQVNPAIAAPLLEILNKHKKSEVSHE
ncbi:TPA: hypothetical protein R3V25_004687 [Citrobacter freundii]|nr:hypothetical protein [Citrobacter freundii]